jgi:histidyl-tRNA synthetase
VTRPSSIVEAHPPQRTIVTEPLSVKPISGFPEWTPAVKLAEERLLATIREQYELFGFTPIETPAVERMDVLTSKGGLQRQVFAVSRPQEGDEADLETDLGLHFDLTVPLARYVVQHAGQLSFPFRRYQIQKVWRGERAQRGRYREFYQCDIDVVGRNSLDLVHDAEMPCVIDRVLTALGVPDFSIRVSNRKILFELIAAGGVPTERGADVLRAVDKAHRTGAEKTRRILAAEGLDAPLVDRLLELIACEDVAAARAILTAAGATTTGLDELAFVLEHAASFGMTAGRLRPDFSIARGLDYYTGTVYETFVTGQEKLGSVCSGGRYDDLASFFSKEKFPGVGLSIGLSRLFDLMERINLVDTTRSVPTDVLVTTQDRDRYLHEYLGLGRLLRDGGLRTQVYLEAAGLGKQFGYAERNGIPFAVVAGETEIASGTVAVKDLAARSQETIPRDDLVAYLRTRIDLLESVRKPAN